MMCTVYHCPDLDAYRYEVVTPQGLHSITLHTTRHTYCSPIMARLLEAGWPNAAVREWAAAYLEVCQQLDAEELAQEGK